MKKSEQESVFKYKHNLWKVQFLNGTIGFMVADSKEILEKFYEKTLGKGKIKSIVPQTFGIVE